MRACGPRRPSCSACTGSATSRAGRSPVATSSSCAAGRRSRSSRSSATTTRTSGRSPGCSPTSPTATATRPSGSRRHRATSRVSPARSPASTGSSEALDCLEAAADRPIARTVVRDAVVGRGRAATRRRPVVVAAPTRGLRWSPGAAVDRDRRAPRSGPRRALDDRADRRSIARTCSAGSGRHAEAAEAWAALAAGPGRIAIVAAIELAKIREHRLRDRPGALDAVVHGLDAVERRRRLGRPEPALEADLEPPRDPAAPAARPRLDGARPPTAARPATALDRPDLRDARSGRPRGGRAPAPAGRARPHGPGRRSRPGPSTASEPAAAAKRRSGDRRDRCRPTMAGRRTDASSAARNVSPAPVGSISRSVAVGR